MPAERIASFDTGTKCTHLTTPGPRLRVVTGPGRGFPRAGPGACWRPGPSPAWQTFTFSAHATGSDGSTITSHEVVHVTLLPGGKVAVSFDKPSLSCG